MAKQAVSWDSSNSASKYLEVLGAIAGGVDDSIDYIKKIYKSLEKKPSFKTISLRTRIVGVAWQDV